MNKRKTYHAPRDAGWMPDGGLLSTFFEHHDLFGRLCSEVAYILHRAVKLRNIDIASIATRVKSFPSILRKMRHHNISDPFRELTDLAGARIIYLYKSDKPSIDRMIAEEFDVVEKDDKLEKHGVSEFGYSAVHYLVRLSPGNAGARYDDLKDLICEIQCRTIGQDTWAVISRCLFYESNADVPHDLLRELNGLAGLLESADNQFDRIRGERMDYINKARDGISNQTSLELEVNLDSLLAYLATMFALREESIDKHYLSAILNRMDRNHYRTLREISALLTSTSKEVEEYASEKGISALNPADHLAIALAIGDSRDRRREDNEP